VLLRLHLAESMVRANQERTRHSAEYLLQDDDIAALLQQKPQGAKARGKEAPSLSLDDLDPGRVWDCYEREFKRDDAFTERWKASLEQIQSVHQLFLVT
jgi:hypothetical protein